MKKTMILRVLATVFMLQLCAAVALAQGVELGYDDFPYTASDGNVISASYSGTYTPYPNAWTSCGVTTKARSIWLGSSDTGTMHNGFSQPVTSVTYNITASNIGETVTVTTNAPGTPTITVSAGCDYSVVGNVLTFTGNGDSGAAGARITVTSSTPFTTVEMVLDGNGSGSLVTLEYGSGPVASIPVSPWAIAALFLILSFIGYKMLRKPAMPAV